MSSTRYFLSSSLLVSYSFPRITIIYWLPSPCMMLTVDAHLVELAYFSFFH